MKIRVMMRSLLLAGSIVGVAASAAVAAPDYTLLTTIAVPTVGLPTNMQPNGTFNAFDISFADPVTGNIFIADRSNASVDIFSGSSLTFLGRATGFTGQQATTSISGADGVVAVTSGTTTTLYAGDGNSTLKVFNATNPAAPTQLQAIPTGGGFATPCGPTISCRVDEMAYSPTQHLLLAANNADAPAFGNLFTTTGPANMPATLTFPHGPPNTFPNNQITVPSTQGGIAGGGMEQSAWNPTTGTFFVSIPALASAPPPAPPNPGGVSEIDIHGNVLHTFDFGTMGITSCSPSGLAVGGSGNMLVGCGNVGAGVGAILISPTGTIIKTFPGLQGTDELWYDPRTKSFYVTGNNGTNTGRFFDVVTDDPLGGIIDQTVDLPQTASAHSITVDPFTGDVFVALAGDTFNTDGTVKVANDTCPLGCIAVYQVPEPGSLPLLVVGLAGLMGLAARRQTR